MFCAWYYVYSHYDYHMFASTLFYYSKNQSLQRRRVGHILFLLLFIIRKQFMFRIVLRLTFPLRRSLDNIPITAYEMKAGCALFLLPNAHLPNSIFRREVGWRRRNPNEIYTSECQDRSQRHTTTVKTEQNHHRAPFP